MTKPVNIMNTFTTGEPSAEKYESILGMRPEICCNFKLL